MTEEYKKIQLTRQDELIRLIQQDRLASAGEKLSDRDDSGKRGSGVAFLEVRRAGLHRQRNPDHSVGFEACRTPYCIQESVGQRRVEQDFDGFSFNDLRILVLLLNTV